MKKYCEGHPKGNRNSVEDWVINKQNKVVKKLCHICKREMPK